MMSMMYQAYQNHMDLTSPWRTGAAAGLKYLNLVPQGVSDRLFRRLAASLELISRSSLTYARPAYGIDRILVGNQELEVTEEVTFATPAGPLPPALQHYGDATSRTSWDASLPKTRGGVMTIDLLLAARQKGFDAQLVTGTPELVQDELRAGRPVILMLQVIDSPGRHYDF